MIRSFETVKFPRILSFDAKAQPAVILARFGSFWLRVGFRVRLRGWVGFTSVYRKRLDVVHVAPGNLIRNV